MAVSHIRADFHAELQKVWDMENGNMHGHWTGIFMLKSRTKRKHLRMIDSSVGAFLSYRIIPSLCIFPM